MAKIYLSTILVLLLIPIALSTNHENWDTFIDDLGNEVIAQEEETQLPPRNNQNNNQQEVNPVSSSPIKPKYTQNFYLAMGAGFIGILILVILAYLLFKKPESQFKKK